MSTIETDRYTFHFMGNTLHIEGADHNASVPQTGKHSGGNGGWLAWPGESEIPKLLFRGIEAIEDLKDVFRWAQSGSAGCPPYRPRVSHMLERLDESFTILRKSVIERDKRVYRLARAIGFNSVAHEPPTASWFEELCDKTETLTINGVEDVAFLIKEYVVADPSDFHESALDLRGQLLAIIRKVPEARVLAQACHNVVLNGNACPVCGDYPQHAEDCIVLNYHDHLDMVTPAKAEKL